MMGNRSVTFGLALLVLLAGVMVFYFSKSKKSNRVVSEEVLTEFNFDDTSTVTQIDIHDATLGQKVSIKRDGNVWLANGAFRARQDLVNLLLNTFRTIRFQNHVPESSRETILKQLVTGNKEVKIYLNGVHTYTWFVGYPTMDHEGTYMLLEQLVNGTWERSKDPVIMGALRFKGELRTRFTADILDWRHTGLFEYNPKDIRSIMVKYFENPTYGFEAKLSDNEKFSLYSNDGKQISGFDTSAMRAYFIQFKKVHFEMFNRKYTEKAKDSLRLEKPIFEIAVTDKMGMVKKIITYPIQTDASKKDFTGAPIEYDQDRMHGFVENDLVIVQYYVFDPLTVKLSDFLRRRPTVENNSQGVNNPMPN